jgi:RHS repeat-associated protein
MKLSFYSHGHQVCGGVFSKLAPIHLALLVAIWRLFTPPSVESQSCCGNDTQTAPACGENKIRVFYWITAYPGCYPADSLAGKTMYLDVDETDEYSAPVGNLLHEMKAPGVCEFTPFSDPIQPPPPPPGTIRRDTPTNGIDNRPYFCIERGHFANITLTVPDPTTQKFKITFAPDGCGASAGLGLEGPTSVLHYSFEGLNPAPQGAGEADVGSVRLRLSAGGGNSIWFERALPTPAITAAELRCFIPANLPPASSAVTDPVYGPVVRTSTHTNPSNPPYSEKIVDTANGVTTLRQIVSREGLTTVERLLTGGFELRCYRIAGAKQSDGLYAALGSPHAIWRVEQPGNSTNQVLITEIHGAAVTPYTYYYTAPSGSTPASWDLRKGNSPRLEGKITFTNLANNNIITIRQVRDVSNPTFVKLVSREVEVRDNQSRLLRTVRGDTDANYEPIGDADWTAYAYSTEGLLLSMRRSDGYYEIYQTTRALKMYDPVPPAPEEAYIRLTITTTFSPQASLFAFANGRTGSNRIVEETVDDKGGDRISEVTSGYPRGKTATTSLPANLGVLGAITTRTPSGGAAAVSQSLSYASTLSAPTGGMPYYSLAEDGSETTTTYAAGTYSADTFTFTPDPNGPATRTEVSHTIPHAPGSREISVLDENGNLALEETHRLTLAGPSAETLLTRRASLYTPGGHLRETRLQAGQDWRIIYEATWDDDHALKLSERDETGVETVFSNFDGDRRPQTITRTALAAANGLPAVPAQVREVLYDAEGRLVSETLSTAGAPSRIHLWWYDTAGRLAIESTSRGPITYTYTPASYTNLSSKVGRSVKKTSDTGASEITQYNLDGTIASISDGLNPVAQSWTYLSGSVGAASGVQEKHTQGSGANQTVATQTIRDYLGQLLQEREFLAGAPSRSKTYGYSATGQPTSLSDSAVPGSANPVMSSDGVTTTLRCGGDEPDRTIVETTDHIFDDGAYWLRTQNSQAGSVWQKITGLSGTQLSVTRRVNLAGAIEVATVTVDRGARSVTTEVSTPGIGNLRVTITRAGMVQSIKEPALASATIITSNGFGQEVSRSDPHTPLIAITTTYDSVWGAPETITRGSDITSCTYFPAGLGGKSGQLATRSVNGLVTRYDYDSYGRLLYVWGATYPLRYEYDAAGRLSKLHTFRLGTSWFGSAWPGSTGATTIPGEAVTSFIYSDGSARLWKKQYPDGTFTEYAYSGLKSWRYWARSSGGSRLMTTYTSNYQDELIGLAYSDPTPPVQYRRDAKGRLSHVSDAAGEHDFTYAYDPAGNLTSTETVAANATNIGATTFTHTFDPVGRPTGYTFSDSIQPASPIAVSYTYDPDTGQFTAVKRGAETIGSYSYNPQSGWMDVMGNITRFPDEQGRVQKIIRTGDNPLTPTFLVKYDFDSAGRRRRLTREDGSYWEYGYNGRSEVSSGIKYYADATEIPGFRFTYEYDAIGNRLQSTAGPIGSTPVTYTPNDLNQYESRTIPGSASVRGQASTPPGYTLYVNEHPVTADSHGHFFYAQSVDNTTGPKYLKNSVIALKKDPAPPLAKVENSDIYIGKTPLVSLPADETPGTPANPLYDEDGNTIRDERWHYTWDAENRLVALDTLPEAVQAGAPDLHLTYNYDYRNRRVSKSASNLTQNSIATRYFTYDGWNLVREYESSVSSGAPRLALEYFWGLDISSRLRGAGGGGGLLAVTSTDSDNVNHPLYDGNGNVIHLLSSTDMSNSAEYEYSPFGENLRSTGSGKNANPFRFSTKFSDEDTGHLYYGFRYYLPQSGRWLSRDPIGENGGNNVYGFCLNAAVRYVDRDGRTIEFTGEQSAIDAGKKLLEEAKEKASDQLRTAIRNIEDDKTACKIKLTWNSTIVIIGNYDLEEIDLGDINELPAAGGGLTIHSAFVHELYEQWMKQKGQRSYQAAHYQALQAEASVSGNRRIDTKDTLNGNNPVTPRVLSGTITFKFRRIIKVDKDGRETLDEKVVTQTINVNSGTIESVTEK